MLISELSDKGATVHSVEFLGCVEENIGSLLALGGG